MSRRRAWPAATAVALAMSLSGVPARAESVYVIDQLLVGVHAERTLNSVILIMVPTGTELEVLERGERFVRVQAEDGTTGWVDGNYLTPDQPALRARHRAIYVLREPA